MNAIRSKVLAGAMLVLGTSLALPTAFAGPGSGVSIWRNSPKPDKIPAAPATSGTMAAPCTDSRVISVKEAKWVRGNGRGMTIVDAGKTLVCNSCATPVAVSRPVDRNSNGPKAGKPSRGLHDCTKGGCGTVVASLD